MLPYENVIHLKRFYGKNDIFDGANSNGDHDAILKTIKTKDGLLQRVESTVFSSFKIKGLIKINGMLKEADKQKQVDEFIRAIMKAIKSESAIVPINGKAGLLIWLLFYRCFLCLLTEPLF